MQILIFLRNLVTLTKEHVLSAFHCQLGNSSKIVPKNKTNVITFNKIP